MTNAIKIILSSVLLALFCTGVSAQIRIIVPFAVGGAFDQMARNFGKYFVFKSSTLSLIVYVTILKGYCKIIVKNVKRE